MGELIAFKPVRGGARLRPASIDRSSVVVFTGVRQERMEVPQNCETKSGEARRALQKRRRKCKGKAAGGSKGQGAQRE